MRAAQPRLRVLVVDDDSDTAAIAILLTKHGHDIRTARDGGQAIQRARAFCPHFILTQSCHAAYERL
jgi:CheY-like chemotaxis protein